jgi:multicomponent Na+:H+ antiporter subunit B
MGNIDDEIRDSKKGMTSIVKTIVRFVMGIIVLFGCYIVLYGHLTPGGGFSGGVILASAFIILVLAFGREMGLRKMGDRAASIMDNSGALAFIVIGLLGYTAGYFFLNFIDHGTIFDLFSSGIIPLCNIAIGIKVTSSLFAIFIALSIFGRFISSLVEEEE